MHRTTTSDNKQHQRAGTAGNASETENKWSPKEKLRQLTNLKVDDAIKETCQKVNKIYAEAIVVQPKSKEHHFLDDQDDKERNGSQDLEKYTRTWLQGGPRKKNRIFVLTTAAVNEILEAMEVP